jgi:Flp pilus assembly protein CpaB
MGLDKIIVLLLVVLFFGGIALLAWSSRRAERLKGAASEPSSKPAKQPSEENPREFNKIKEVPRRPGT